MKKCMLLYATQTGKARACCRRVSRILRENTHCEIVNGSAVGANFEDEIRNDLESFAQSCKKEGTTLILFVSTTGDGEHVDAIKNTWKLLLRKSVPENLFADVPFMIFSLGDRSYGPQFCAAGRKLAVRLMQLGASPVCEPGYGDENTPSGGIFADLDVWVQDQLIPAFGTKGLLRSHPVDSFTSHSSLYALTFVSEEEISQKLETESTEWQDSSFRESYSSFFETCAPLSRYSYSGTTASKSISESSFLTGNVIENERITASEWTQDTRHIVISVNSFGRPVGNGLPYHAGDIASIMPFNDDDDVERLLSVLPVSIKEAARRTLRIRIEKSPTVSVGRNFNGWPQLCTLWGLLKYCADIKALPEQEDLRALAQFCSLDHPHGMDQRDKLVSLSDSTSAALYTDYILREKRSWADVIYDFDSVRHESSQLGVKELLSLLSPMRPRDFSIASSPTELRVCKKLASESFLVDLCVAVVEGKTRLGRQYHGLCSSYLAGSRVSTNILLWIRPGTFSGLPVSPHELFSTPVLYIGAGTGVAPLRGLIRERIFRRSMYKEKVEGSKRHGDLDCLVFGCRKREMDLYYRDEWEVLAEDGEVKTIFAFSQDQRFKFYVQQALRQREDESPFLYNHIIEKRGAVYVAGGSKMARAVKDEIVELLSKSSNLDEKRVRAIISRYQREGLFSIEAWS